MGCCDSKERKDKDQKFYDSNTYDEESTKYEQDDYRMAILKKNIQRQDIDKQAAKQGNNNQQQRSRSKNNLDIKSKDTSLMNSTNNLIMNEIGNDSVNYTPFQKKQEKQENQSDIEDQEERKSVHTEFYTPPNNPSEIPHSYQEDSFMLELQLNSQPQPYMEYDPYSRRTQIKQNFEEQSDQLMRSGSVPIYLKNSKAFIITSGGQNFDLKQFLEETKSALESVQQTQHGNVNKEQVQEIKNIPIPDSSTDNSEELDVEEDQFSSPKNLFDADFDNEVNDPFGKGLNSKKKIQHFNDLDNLENIHEHSRQMMKLRPEQRWDYKNIEEELTPKEQKIFNQFKQYFNEVTYYNLKSEISDHYLVRFLTAKKFDLNHSKRLLDDHLSWRMTENINTIFQDFKFEESELIKQYYPHGLHYTDNQGRPIYIERLGKLDYNKLFQVTTQERLVKYYICFYEKMIKHIFQQCTTAKGQRIDKMVVILDCKDISLRIDQITSFLRTAVNITKENYPEILHKMYIVNTGMMFNIAWKAVSVLLGEKTKKKINIMGTKFIHNLEEEIPKEHIPKFLGGKCKCNIENCMNNNYGP